MVGVPFESDKFLSAGVSVTCYDVMDSDGAARMSAGRQGGGRDSSPPPASSGRCGVRKTSSTTEDLGSDKRQKSRNALEYCPPNGLS